MDMRLGCGAGLYEWRGEGPHEAPVRTNCSLSRVDLLTAKGTAVDNAAHLLLHEERLLPCDRDIEALLTWRQHALLLSSDTDCVSLWDREGMVRTLRVGVYPQDMALYGDAAVICGGADGKAHLIALPELHPLMDYALPGMPERICIRGESAYLLTLITGPEVQTALLELALPTGRYRELARFPGLPGAICATYDGLWVAVSEMLLHLSPDAAQVHTVIEGFSLIRHLDAQGSSVLATDPLEGLCARVTKTPRPSVEVLYRGDVGMAVFAP